MILDSFITDYFDLPVSEELAKYYSRDEIILEVQKRIRALQNIGEHIDTDMIADCLLLDGTDPTAGVKPIAEHQYIFVLSKLAARKQNEKYLDTIIYHELCHILQMEFLFNAGLLYYVENKLNGLIEQKEMIDQLYNANNHHTYLWHSFANKINRLLLVIPPVAEKLSNKDLADIFLESFYSGEFEIDGDCMDNFKETK